MKRILLIAALLCAGQAHAQTQDQLEKQARRGDYQAQRNLAYSYASPMKGEKEDKLAACVWYLVVIKSGSDKVDIGDTGNAKVYCSKLERTEQIAADAKSNELVRKIYGR